MRNRRSIFALLAVGLTACGEASEPVPKSPARTPVAPAGSPLPEGAQPPAWAKVASEQVAAARAVAVPVAFENSIGMRFVLIPAGTFTMGSPATEESRDEDETAHEVTLTRPYYLQTTEVTNAQYRRFRADHDSGTTVGGRSLNGDEQPVVHVSWDEAIAFVRWLSEQDRGHAYRLPTEAEWERACRAGTSTPYWWGTSIRTDQANYFDGVFDEKREVEQKATVPVGSFPVSPWGLYDVHGNAGEWCSDRLDHDADYSPGRATDPVGHTTGPIGVHRGGNYGNSAHMLRAAFRAWIEGSDETRSYIGLRVAASPPAK